MAFPESWSSFGPKMLALRDRERRFVWAFLMNAMTDGQENGAQAARDAGYSDVKEGAKVRAHGLLHRGDVLDAMNEVAGRELRGLAIPAVVALGKLVSSAKHPDHRKSIEMVLNRVGHGERSAIDINVSGEITVNHTDEAIEQLRQLRELGVPRVKLEEVFGFSGLARYEKMLAEVERKRIGGKVIDGEAVEVSRGE